MDNSQTLQNWALLSLSSSPLLIFSLLSYSLTHCGEDWKNWEQKAQKISKCAVFAGLIAPHKSANRKISHSLALFTSRCEIQEERFLRDFKIFNFLFLCTQLSHTQSSHEILEKVPFNASPTQQMCVVLGLSSIHPNLERKTREKLSIFSQLLVEMRVCACVLSHVDTKAVVEQQKTRALPQFSIVYAMLTPSIQLLLRPTLVSLGEEFSWEEQKAHLNRRCCCFHFHLREEIPLTLSFHNKTRVFLVAFLRNDTHPALFWFNMILLIRGSTLLKALKYFLIQFFQIIFFILILS